MNKGQFANVGKQRGGVEAEERLKKKTTTQYPELFMVVHDNCKGGDKKKYICACAYIIYIIYIYNYIKCMDF